MQTNPTRNSEYRRVYTRLSDRIQNLHFISSHIKRNKNKMKVLICLSVFLASSLATYVSYPYVYRTPVIQNGFYPSGYGFGAPALTVVKPLYPGFYDYRFGLGPSLYQPGIYPGNGLFAAAPTIIHLIPAEPGSDKKKPKKNGKPKDDKDEETTTMTSEDNKAEELEKAEARDEGTDEGNSDSVEVETV